MLYIYCLVESLWNILSAYFPLFCYVVCNCKIIEDFMSKLQPFWRFSVSSARSIGGHVSLKETKLQYVTAFPIHIILKRSHAKYCLSFEYLRQIDCQSQRVAFRFFHMR